MSCYEWEAGTIKLPTVDAPRVRDAVKAAADAHRNKLYEAAQTFWKELPAAYKRDKEKYNRAVQAFMYGNRPSNDPHHYFPPGLPDKKLPAWPGVPHTTTYNGYFHDLDWLLSSMLPYGTEAPRRVKREDVDRIVGKTTGVKFTVNCGEPTITFDGRSVTWDVPNNNHACEHGREHVIAQAFFKALDRVKWTRGSGGTIVGNNEYSRDSREPGGGGNYVVTEYGPNVKRPPRYRW